MRGIEGSSTAVGDVGRYRAELQEIYRDLDARISALAPVCRLSGRCCRFEEYGHTLFVSAPEAALLLADAPAPLRPLDGGATCPWQDGGGRCTARDARPLGCRVYYCDPAFERQAPDLSEAFIGRLKRLVEERDLPWDYAPLHYHLRMAESDGRFPAPPRVPDRPTTDDAPAGKSDTSATVNPILT